MIEVKKFGDKEITIRTLLKSDLKYPEKFQKYINSLIQEKGFFVTFKKFKTVNDEIAWLKNSLKLTDLNKMIVLIAENQGRIVGETAIMLLSERRDHVGEMGISIIKHFRGIGLGSYLAKNVIALANKNLKPQPKLIRLSTISNNKQAISFYKKIGFKKVALIPQQIKINGEMFSEIIMLYP